MPKPSLETLNPDNYNFKITIPTRFTDINAGQHISNYAIITMFEDARARFYAQKEIKIVDGSTMLMIVNNNIDYLREAHWPLDFEVYCRIEKVGGASFQLRQIGLQNGQVVATCLLTSVHTIDGKAAPLSGDLRFKLLQ